MSFLAPTPTPAPIYGKLMSLISLYSVKQFHICRKLITFVSLSHHFVSLRKEALSYVLLCCSFTAINHFFIITLELFTEYIVTLF